MTKEEKRREQKRAWARRNKDNRKAYREANKDKIASRMKLYSKAYRENNKEKMSDKSKNYRESKKHKPLVYLIESCNYIGVTENIYHRLAVHKHKGKDVSNVFILSEFETREEALILEKNLHNIGYNGAHSKLLYK